MGAVPIIRRITLSRYRFPFEGVGRDLSFAMGPFYEPGGKGARSVLGIRIETDMGVTGEYMSIAPGVFEQVQQFADFLIGKSALERERFYNQAKSILRKQDKMGIGPIDIALWDLAGKLHDAPIYQLLGGYREKLPALRQHLPRRPPTGRFEQPRGIRGLRGAVPKSGLSGIQDTFVGRGIHPARGGDGQCGRQASRRQDGADD